MTEDLDLHGMKHEEVDRLVENYVLLNEPPFNIITGLSDEMKKLVIDVLERNEITWELNYWNAGQIIVRSW